MPTQPHRAITIETLNLTRNPGEVPIEPASAQPGDWLRSEHRQQGGGLFGAHNQGGERWGPWEHPQAVAALTDR